MSARETAALEPGERIALTVALAQVERGEAPSPNVAAVCVMALARIVAALDQSTTTPGAYPCCTHCGTGCSGRHETPCGRIACQSQLRAIADEGYDRARGAM